MSAPNFADLPNGATFPKGRWRLALVCAASRIEKERGEDGEPLQEKFPLPRNAIERTAYNFLKKCEFGDPACVKELGDRLDGKSAQSVELTGTLALTHEQALEALK